jgi:hypothetical protein
MATESERPRGDDEVDADLPPLPDPLEDPIDDPEDKLPPGEADDRLGPVVPEDDLLPLEAPIPPDEPPSPESEDV